MDENFDLKHYPEVVIAKKIYEKKQRIWKLKRMDIEGGDMNLKKKEGKDPREKQFDEFMEDLEYEPDMRANMNLFRVGGIIFN
jgi:nonsense-mediated mRNA decay protein 3